MQGLGCLQNLVSTAFSESSIGLRLAHVCFLGRLHGLRNGIRCAVHIALYGSRAVGYMVSLGWFRVVVEGPISSQGEDMGEACRLRPLDSSTRSGWSWATTPEALRPT